MLNDRTILITGGTGSFGRAFAKYVFSKFKPHKIIIFSRDEYKQFEMKKEFSDERFPIRFFLGDIRDKDRLYRAFQGVDYVVHAAALKQVPALEYNPIEAVKTNIVGADNIVDAAIDTKVKKVIVLSTDKAVSPVNLYGATKLVAEKIFIAANAYAGNTVKFSIVRYGNVVGSRGSVIPSFLSLKKQGTKEFPITDERMTRFWITLQQGLSLALRAIEEAQGGEVFIPRIPSMKITDLAKAIEPKCKFIKVGIRPGEKIHEILISEDEARKTKIVDGIFVILPQFFANDTLYKKYEKFEFVPDGFVYRSDTNDDWLHSEKLLQMIREFKHEGYPLLAPAHN
ncbi:UDP-N-acetylglucosamine 4,6-dehydratase (inverting) [Candidatus Omnitrophota bacterium]